MNWGCIINPVGCAAQGAADAMGNTAMGILAKAVTEGVAAVVKGLGSAWILVPSPVLTATDGSSPSESVSFVRDSLWLITASLFIVALVVGAIRMMIEHRAEPAKRLVELVVTYTVVTSAGMFVLALVVAGVDMLAAWILDRSTEGTDFSTNLMSILVPVGSSGLGVLLIIVLGLVAVCVSLGQIAMMVLRYALLPLVAGVWPTFAAFINTKMGKHGFERLTSWILALAFYKLPAAIIYGLAFRMFGAKNVYTSDPDGLLTMISGMTLMIVALVALPALVKLVSPLSGQISHAAGGGMGMVLGMAGGSLASGAIHSGTQQGTTNQVGTSGPQGGSGSPGQQGPSGGNAPASGPNPDKGGQGSNPNQPSTAGAPGTTPGTGPNAGATAGAGAGDGAGAGATTGAAGGATAGGAAAAGPAAPAVLGAQAAMGAAQAAQSTVKGAADGAVGDGPSGAGK